MATIIIIAICTLIGLGSQMINLWFNLDRKDFTKLELLLQVLGIISMTIVGGLSIILTTQN